MIYIEEIQKEKLSEETLGVNAQEATTRACVRVSRQTILSQNY